MWRGAVDDELGDGLDLQEGVEFLLIVWFGLGVVFFGEEGAGGLASRRASAGRARPTGRAVARWLSWLTHQQQQEDHEHGGGDGDPRARERGLGQVAVGCRVERGGREG